MSLYAKIENNIVVNTFICSDSEVINIPGYNIKVTEDKKTPIIGGTYDVSIQKFIPPKPHESWVLDETSFEWVSPIGENPSPLTKYWDEDSLSWLDR